MARSAFRGFQYPSLRDRRTSSGESLCGTLQQRLSPHCLQAHAAVVTVYASTDMQAGKWTRATATIPSLPEATSKAILHHRAACRASTLRRRATRTRRRPNLVRFKVSDSRQS